MSLKIAHWTMFNNSGMFRMAESFAKAECALGLQSYLVNYQDPEGYEEILDADIHVVHTHLPDDVRQQLTRPLKLVWMGHGTPEYVFLKSVIDSSRGYGVSDSWQLIQYWMQQADALVTFWPRHQRIWKSLCDKRTIVDCIPMGVEKDFWQPVQSLGKYLGSPSVFTAENCDFSKWPLDLMITWPWVCEELPVAHLHCVYLPNDQHRWFFPLMNRNGAGFKTIAAGIIMDKVTLRNAFCSTDYFISLVRYGDFNRLSLEANATGAKIISYAGNEYADYWIQEGDQRGMAKSLVSILKGEINPRKKKLETPDISETAKAMFKIYERIM